MRWDLRFALMLFAVAAFGQTYTVLHNFGGPPGDGRGPGAGPLIGDPKGNLYGTTQSGGAFNWGVLYKLDSTGKFTVLHNFAGGPADGGNPNGGLLMDLAGNLYGTTLNGGPSNGGTVFKLDATDKLTILYSFTGVQSGSEDGFGPSGGLVRDFQGNLYGTTFDGGGSGFGVVFKVDANGHETVLHRFAGAPTDGWEPSGFLIRDFAGSLYGTTNHGGTSDLGVVFKLDSTGRETILHSFSGSDGANPVAGLLRDLAGNLYGTTFHGGASGLGVVFELESTGKETVLHSFAGGPLDGVNPGSGLLRDLAGNLYGTTVTGGDSNDGTVFKLEPAGKITILHSFRGTDGYAPYAGLLSFAGYFYGVTFEGGPAFGVNFGYGLGVVFRLRP